MLLLSSSLTLTLSSLTLSSLTLSSSSSLTSSSFSSDSSTVEIKRKKVSTGDEKFRNSDPKRPLAIETRRHATEFDQILKN